MQCVPSEIFFVHLGMQYNRKYTNIVCVWGGGGTSVKYESRSFLVPNRNFSLTEAHYITNLHTLHRLCLFCEHAMN